MNFNKLLLLLFVLSLTACQSETKVTESSTTSTEFAQHPLPSTPIFFDVDVPESLKAQLPPPPSEDSAKQKADVRELLKLQQHRTTADCERAQTEIQISLQSFYGKPYGPLTDSEVEILSDFFKKVRNDADFVIRKIKNEYSRQRPYEYIKELEPCLKKEATKSYPSGHATLSKLYALILEDLIPSEKKQFEARAKEIGHDRILGGVHHPTDVSTGQKLAVLLHNEFLKSKKYQSLYGETKALLPHY